MPSPFPGMDPYLEPHWPAIHQVLITDAWQRLNDQLPDDLVACVEERVSIEQAVADGLVEGAIIGRVGPDVRVLAPDRSPATPGPVTINAPMELQPGGNPAVAARYVAIVDASGRVITAIEFVSPSNKRAPDMARFRANRAALLGGGVHCVEVDLVRGGRWRALMAPETCPAGGVTAYRAVVRTAGPEARSFLYPVPLRSPLPDVEVPLRERDAAAVLPLQAMLTDIYRKGRWAKLVDYARPLRPPLDLDDAAWAAALLAGRSH